MPITINEDTTFLISDELGNAPAGGELGLYYDDPRFLCRYELTLDGRPPVPLAARATDYYAAAHYLASPALRTVPRGQLSLVRKRLVGQGLHEDLDITNHGDREADFPPGVGWVRVDGLWVDRRREVAAVTRAGDTVRLRVVDGGPAALREER